MFAQAMQDAEQLRTAQAESERETALGRRAEMAQLASAFEGSVGQLAAHLSSAAHEMEATARAMTARADQTTRQSMGVASAAQQTSANVQTVAAATEELAASVQEVASQVGHSSEIAGRAVTDAQRTSEIVQALASSAERIDAVVALISSIAGQTNLLALNATIEAARAGEAGRGFAVVAGEVKELASQTARATNEIATQIGQVQAATREAVSAIAQITRTISEMSGIADFDLGGYRGAGSRHPRDCPERAGSGTRYPARDGQHRSGARRRRTDRRSSVPGAQRGSGTLTSFREPDAGSRQLPR